MQTKLLGLLAMSALIGSYNLTAAAAPPDMDDVPLTLSGCVSLSLTRDARAVTSLHHD